MKSNFQDLQHNPAGLLPARVPAELAAKILGFRPEDIPVLVAAKKLTPLGHPPRNGPKYFATVILQELASDPAWLAKASDAITSFWREKNRSRRANRNDNPTTGMKSQVS